MPSTTLLVVLGNQLFPHEHLPAPDSVDVFLCEDRGLCTYERHHQQKIVLFLSAMRSYADGLRAAGYRVLYRKLDDDDQDYEARLEDAIDETGAARIEHFEIEDRPMEARIARFAERRGLERRERRSPMFLASRDAFADYARGRKRLLMADFYKAARIEHGILVEDDGSPTGGRWSFDEDNRKKLPARITPPPVPAADRTAHTKDVVALVSKSFSDHPGNADDFWWPTTRDAALAWLDRFVNERLDLFGPYEDAISTRSDTVFHSTLTPVLNLGLITPREVVDAVLEAAQHRDIPLQSLEGFIRQVIGWREFIRGIYREFGEQQATTNFWAHERTLGRAWYDGTTGIPPLDDTIRTAEKLGWTHHIPRLMVAGNLMTLCEVRPDAAHRWFMEMYVDSSEWVMGPNVYGMGIFSDGGIFATKPYICGSNYLRKMSDYGKGDWCDVVDGLYWRFIAKHRDFFAGNPRLALMPRALDRLDSDRRERIGAAADRFIDTNTVEPA
jgi:deoxyribodipyrimidine photolyase-related protein